MTNLIEEGAASERRQDVQPIYRINGSLYLWRTAFVRSARSWRREGRHLVYEIPESRAMSIDTADQFEHAELLVKNGRVTLPWLSESPVP
jgi:CMP-N-acetylneuraminic acid synthetase